MQTYLTDDYFTLDKTKPVNFFYKLPQKIRIKCEILYADIFGSQCFMWIEHNKCVGDFYMKNITFEQFKRIRENTPNSEYIIFLEYYKILQPVIKKIIETNDLYEKYPECLI